MSRPTLKHIADRAGISTMAVSRALRGAGRESPATCARVNAIAAELGYRPNGSARAMRRGSTGAIGLLRSTDSSAATMSHSFLWLLERELGQHDLHLVMGQVPDTQLTDSSALPRLLREWSVDGVFVSYTAHAPERMLELLAELHIPAVWLNAKLASNCVYPDDFGTCRTATERLLTLGHRRIAYLGPALSPRGHYSTVDRFEACRQACARADATFSSLFGEKTTPDPLGQTLELLRRPDRPTAILTYSPYEAATVLVAAARLGLDIPRDVSLVCVREEDTLLGGVAVTSHQILVSRMASAAVDLLLRRIADPLTDLAPVAVPMRTVTDGTCAGAPETPSPASHGLVPCDPTTTTPTPQPRRSS